MKIKNVLSIDWDYLIDVSFEDRLLYFPDGNDYKMFLNNMIWSSMYASSNGSKINDMGIMVGEYGYLKKLLSKVNSKVPMGVDDSHMMIVPFLENVLGNDKINIYNIDFHGDVFSDAKSIGDVNCGNWLSYLVSKGMVKKSVWVRSKDSDIGDSESKIDVITEDIKVLDKVKFDAIFICKSSGWSPPHLDDYFIRLVLPLIFKSKKVLSGSMDDILRDRYKDILPNISKDREMIEKLMGTVSK